MSNPVALGALAPDSISSTCYGTEQILVELVPAAGMAAFVLLLPITGVILFVLVLVAASYREVVMAYTQAGGSYIVARGKLGSEGGAGRRRGAVDRLRRDSGGAVGGGHGGGGLGATCAGALPAWGSTVGVVLVICYLNLRGVREAGRPFAVATYSFVTLTTLSNRHRCRPPPLLRGVCRRTIRGTLPVLSPYHTRQRPGYGCHCSGTPAVRQRRLVADRSGGYLQRGQCICGTRRALTRGVLSPQWPAFSGSCWRA